jgi:hypothetical protein
MIIHDPNSIMVKTDLGGVGPVRLAVEALAVVGRAIRTLNYMQSSKLWCHLVDMVPDKLKNGRRFEEIFPDHLDKVPLPLINKGRKEKTNPSHFNFGACRSSATPPLRE